MQLLGDISPPFFHKKCFHVTDSRKTVINISPVCKCLPLHIRMCCPHMCCHLIVTKNKLWLHGDDICRIIDICSRIIDICSRLIDICSAIIDICFIYSPVLYCVILFEKDCYDWKM